MTTLNIRVTSLQEVKNNTLEALCGKESARGHFLSFLSWDLLHDTLSPNRMDIIKEMTGAGELSIREVARRVNRDVRAVHSDVTKLITQGVIDKTESGIVFPYDDIHFEFTLKHKAA
ncbi:glycosyl transferase family 1 [Serratia symbiotica]|uniref:HVO_A0114 family putative DNA-binding protein n=1 Tax=Serratia symbiotica TaxID=138074 RepID=UPI00135F467B|nr:winged helix-turn-helix transcriptional regulator [Serratia symbiotica]MBF1994418.1 glycosyl transferase family 1 [Serratia symbiotica]MBQ0957039.1 glycosyl transferase family 1 [Serratia symbiotica]